MDIVIQFLTNYHDTTTGDAIQKPALIARKYLLGEFWIDFLSTFPFEVFAKDHILVSVCKLLKVLRIRKIYSNISKRNFTVEKKALYKIAFFSFLLCVYTHIIACIMWYVLKTDFLWVAPTDFGAIRSRMQDPWSLTAASDDRQIAEYREDYDLFIF